MSFVHAQEMPPLSLDLDPTNKYLEVSLVGTCVADQTSRFLSTRLGSAECARQDRQSGSKAGIRWKGQNQSPVVDGAEARKVDDDSSIRSNELISS